jgi:hypothetical protein
MAYFYIEFGCGCGTNKEFIEAESLFEAEKMAYNEAIENYHTYEGLHGILSWEEIAEDIFGTSDDLRAEDIEEVDGAYFEEIESTINYDAFEITKAQYLAQDLYLDIEDDEEENFEEEVF